MEFKGLKHPGVVALEHTDKNTAEKRTPHPRLVESIILARSALLARQGELKQAEVLLLPLAEKSKPRVATLDLLAKVYAQQGKLEGTRELWLQVVQKEPSNKHALRALLQLCKASLKVGCVQ